MMELKTPRIDGAHMAAALSIGTIALLVLGLQPILLGELVDSRRVSLEGVGLVAMAEILALGLGVLLGDACLPLSRLRRVTIVGALLVAAFDALTLRVSGDLQFAAVRAAAGFSEGILLWIATGVIVRSPSPDRIAGIFFVVQTIAQAALGLIFANSVIPHYGWQGAFVVLAAMGLLACVLTAWQPDHLGALLTPSLSGFRWSTHTVVPLMVVFLQLAALGSLWAYVEPLGKAAGFDAKAVQSLIAGVLVMQVLGGSIGSALVRKLPTVPTLVGGSLVLGLVAAGIQHAMAIQSTVDFALLCAVFGFTWLFLMPFQMALSFRCDPSGRLASLSPAMQVFGIAVGPLTGSFVIHGDDASRIPVVTIAFAATAVVALFVGVHSARHSRSHAAPSKMVG